MFSSTGRKDHSDFTNAKLYINVFFLQSVMEPFQIFSSPKCQRNKIKKKTKGKLFCQDRSGAPALEELEIQLSKWVFAKLNTRQLLTGIYHGINQTMQAIYKKESHLHL